MSRASCLCGDVSWDLEPPYVFMHHCHCSRCRKAHGTPFATYVGAPAEAFRLRGADKVVTWAPRPDAARSFCGRCGSVVPGPPVDGLVFVPAGSFEDDPGERPGDHIFVASKAPWYAIADHLPQYDAFPPGVDATVLPDPPHTPPPAGTVGGSCLCGAVAYEIDTLPLRAYNCHCGRCRKARSAAHAANLFVPLAGLRFTRGEDQRASYKVPEAERFTQTFCRHCGSPVPHTSPERGFAVVPMGSLDDLPAMTPTAHIFVGSKAPWFEIADELPQFTDDPPG
jgi:hypothetical protein